MSAKQKVRRALAKHIYNRLRQLDAKERESQAFNWFETTGMNGRIENRHELKLAIWKFKPKQHMVDKGWQNDHLDRQGRYVAPKLVPRGSYPEDDLETWDD